MLKSSHYFFLLPADLDVEFSEILQHCRVSLHTTVLPIMMVYPFFQKYFVKGIMIGAVKG